MSLVLAKAIIVIIYDLKILNLGFQLGIICFKLISVHFCNVVLTILFVICKSVLKWLGIVNKLAYDSFKLSYLSNLVSPPPL